MVAGQVISIEDVAAFAAPAHLVVAHNAGFDRKFLERFCETFSTKAWACSMSQVDWAGEGHDGMRLSYLATSAGFFYDEHRALNDCLAGIELLARPLPKSGAFGLAHLLDRARRASWRIWAEHAPFDLKDVLKSRGYRWNPEGSAAPKAWYLDVDEEALDGELHFLRTEIYRREVTPPMRRIDAYDRFSERCD
jgi:DNA polymerase-3 subunit epsilon